jgi:hypothetical protein
MSHTFHCTIRAGLAMSKVDEEGFEIESLRELKLAIRNFLAKNPVGHGRRHQEIESVFLATSAVLKQIPTRYCAGVGAVEALQDFIESHERGNGSSNNAGL